MPLRKNRFEPPVIVTGREYQSVIIGAANAMQSIGDMLDQLAAQHSNMPLQTKIKATVAALCDDVRVLMGNIHDTKTQDNFCHHANTLHLLAEEAMVILEETQG